MSIRLHPWLKLTFWALPLAFLWWRLVDHLRIEWSLNPQYAYGWAVPFLCLYLLWRRVAQSSPPERASATARTAIPPGVRAAPSGSSMLDVRCWKFDAASSPRSALLHLPLSAFYFLLAACAFLYLPTRLIQEANPEWRLVSWALALVVVGLTLLLLRTTGNATLAAIHASRFTFPLLFFLVAVPWPSFIEAPIVQQLMRANTGIAVDLLGAMGIPAVQHGNVIEIGSGVIGIDEACSGIRSLQATLMISLFFGELYRLRLSRRLWLLVSGFVLAFGFNVGRTLLLTRVAAATGIGAISSWHDPAGVTILLACFLCLWLIALACKPKAGRAVPCAPPAGANSTVSLDSPAQGSKLEVRCSTFDVHSAPPSPRPSTLRLHLPSSIFHPRWLSVALLAWLLLVEVGTELWYRSHESDAPWPTTWQVQLPRDNPTFRELPPARNTRQILRYDERDSGVWQVGENQRWQATFLRWNPGRIAVNLARSHTPEICLKATGREVISQSGPWMVAVHGLQLPFRSYVVKDERSPVHVFYCLWDDRATTQSFRSTSMTYANRLAPVLAGRRNSGQRSLELAIWGIADPHEVEAAMIAQLGKLIVVAH